MSDFEEKFAEELATQTVGAIAAPAALPLQAIGEAIAGHIKSWRWVHQGRLLNKKTDAEIDEIINQTTQAVQEKIEIIPEGRLQSPPLAIYGPTIEALSYSADEPSLRDMFANLLAKSMDSQTVQNTHPAFVEIIKQLSSDEAKILSALYYIRGMYPLGSVIQPIDDKGSYITIIDKIFLLPTEVGCKNLGRNAEMLDNLDRLKLIDFELSQLGTMISQDNIYDHLRSYVRNNHSITLKEIESLKKKKIGEYYFVKGFVKISAFGTQFANVCINQF